jgi:hypothetical protein
MSAGRPSRGGRPAPCRVAAAALLGLGLLVGGASAAFGEQPTTTTTAPTTTTTTRPRPTTTASPPTTAPPTTQDTAPPETAEPSPAPDNDADVEPVVTEEEPAQEVAAPEATEGQGLTFTTVHNLLVPGDGTEGAQATTTTTAPPPDEGSSADDENRLIWMIIAALAGVAVLVAVLTWRYWLLTRPGLVLEGDEADDAGRGGGSLGYGAAPPAGRPGGPGGRRGPNPAWDEPRDPRRAFVGPPEGVDPGTPPGPSGPIPGRQGADPGPAGAPRRRVGPGGPGGARGPSSPGGPGGPAAPGGPGSPGVQGGRRTTSTPPPGRAGGPPGSAGGQGPRRRDPGGGATPGASGPPTARRSPVGQPGDLRPGAVRRTMGRPPTGVRVQPPARPQPLAGGRAIRDTDIWAPDPRR